MRSLPCGGDAEAVAGTRLAPSKEHDASVRTTRYGWGGGLGTLWYSWPEQRTAAVLLTQVLPPSAALIAAFTCAVRPDQDG